MVEEFCGIFMHCHSYSFKMNFLFHAESVSFRLKLGLGQSSETKSEPYSCVIWIVRCEFFGFKFLIEIINLEKSWIKKNCTKLLRILELMKLKKTLTLFL